MIKANHKRFWVNFSWYYSNYGLKIFFRNIKYVGEYKETKLPLLMIGNHFSWWDGFIQILLNNKYYQRKFHFMMLERELKKAMVLTKIGAFSVSKGRKSSLESLEYAAQLLNFDKNMLLFFPQGKIQSIYTQEFKFEKGLLTYIVNNVKTPYQFVFNVNLIDYQARRKPEITVYHKTYTFDTTVTVDKIEADYNAYAQECMDKQRKK